MLVMLDETRHGTGEEHLGGGRGGGGHRHSGGRERVVVIAFVGRGQDCFIFCTSLLLVF
ncbi:hypothetical protein HanXRQr2_Chr10g0451021 [Helianthus annuus]|uniref:Uncharacterized protein n=1 Tax=Helianthus annuus TaxID=4232 RepID=A0A9K3HZK6_HELAN|nr:hypothetical protein HanXRQr2_Chr10g0451021 [Helianthus annuus]